VGPTSRLYGVLRIEIAFQIARREIAKIALEITIDVMGMILVLDERAINVDRITTNVPELLDKNAKVPHELGSPCAVPGGRRIREAVDDIGGGKLIECQRIVCRWENTFIGKRRKHRPILVHPIPSFY
jgi:hypothetical protein